MQAPIATVAKEISSRMWVREALRLMSDPWVTISSIVMVFLCAALGYGAGHIVALDHRVRAMPRCERGFPSRGLVLETIKSFYVVLVFACFAGYIVFLRYRFGFDGAKYYIDAYAIGAVVGIPVAAWTMGFLKPQNVWEKLKRRVSKVRRAL